MRSLLGRGGAHSSLVPIRGDDMDAVALFFLLLTPATYLAMLGAERARPAAPATG